MAAYPHGRSLVRRFLYVLALSAILTLLVVCIFPFWGRVPDRGALHREWNLFMDKGQNMLRMDNIYEARKQYESALCAARLLKNRPCIGATSLLLGHVSDLRGDYPEAVSWYRESLDITDDYPKRVKLAIGGRENLARACVKQGNLREADRYAVEAANQSKAVYGSITASSLETLAYVRQSQRRFKEAEALYRTDLELCRSGKGSGNEAACLIRLGYLHCAMARYDEAWSEISKALRIARQRQGPYNRDTAEALYALSRICFKRGQLDKASTLSAKAIPIAQRTLGPRDETTLCYILNAARIEAARGHYAAAKGLLEKLISTYEQFYGPDCRRMVAVLEDYESTLWKMGLACQARAAHRRAQGIRHQRPH